MKPSGKFTRTKPRHRPALVLGATLLAIAGYALAPNVASLQVLHLQ